MEKFFEEMWEHIKGFFTEAQGIALSFLSAAAQSIASSGGALLVNAATAAVTAAQSQGGTSEEKFSAAKTAVLATLESEGIKAATNAVHVAIEAAVAKMKADELAVQ